MLDEVKGFVKGMRGEGEDECAVKPLQLKVIEVRKEQHFPQPHSLDLVLNEF